MTLASRGNSASENLRQENQQPNCCVYKTLTLQHLLEKQVTSLQELCSTCDFHQMHLQEPEICFWFTSNAVLKRPVLLKYWLLCPFSMRKPCIEGLLYAPEKPEKCKKGTLSDRPRLSCITSTALLSRWGRQLLKDMTSLGTDFETHAIQQGYVEDPAAKDFVARNSRTIALSEVQGT